MFVLSAAAYPCLIHPSRDEKCAILAPSVAAGAIAGEGMGGVLGAVLQLAGVSGDVYGTGNRQPFCWSTHAQKWAFMYPDSATRKPSLYLETNP